MFGKRRVFVYAGGIQICAAGLLLINRSIKKVLVLENGDEPGGKVEIVDKTPVDTAMREFKEEVKPTAENLSLLYRDVETNVEPIYVPAAKYVLYVVPVITCPDFEGCKWVSYREFSFNHHERLLTQIGKILTVLNGKTFIVQSDSEQYDDCGSCYVNPVIQGSAEWLMSRRGTIGGTAVSAIVGRSRFKSRHEIISELNYVLPIVKTPALIIGNAGEAAVRKSIESKLGISILEIGQAIHKENSNLRASPDGLYVYDNGKLGIVEIKIAYSKARVQATSYDVQRMLEGEQACASSIPPEHWEQMNYTASIVGADEMLYCVCIWDYKPKVHIKRLKPDPGYFAHVQKPCAESAHMEMCLNSHDFVKSL